MWRWSMHALMSALEPYGRLAVHALDAGHAEAVEVVPDPRRARDRVEQARLVGRVIRHQRVREDRIVPEVEGLHLHEEGEVFRPPVVAGELAEGPFHLH